MMFLFALFRFLHNHLVVRARNHQPGWKKTKQNKTMNVFAESRGGGVGFCMSLILPCIEPISKVQNDMSADESI